jgi:hypothetical protein
LPFLRPLLRRAASMSRASEPGWGTAAFLAIACLAALAYGVTVEACGVLRCTERSTTRYHDKAGVEVGSSTTCHEWQRSLR